MGIKCTENKLKKLLMEIIMINAKKYIMMYQEISSYKKKDLIHQQIQQHI